MKSSRVGLCRLCNKVLSVLCSEWRWTLSLGLHVAGALAQMFVNGQVPICLISLHHPSVGGEKIYNCFLK